MPRQKKISREPVERAVQYIGAIIRQIDGDKPLDASLFKTFVVNPLKTVENMLDHELNPD